MYGTGCGGKDHRSGIASYVTCRGGIVVPAFRSVSGEVCCWKQHPRESATGYRTFGVLIMH